jgi:transcriptional regulator with XRE-family HTH domain
MAEGVYRLLGARIEQFRSITGMTQLELAKRMKLTRTSITNIEAGRQRMQLHDVERLAAAFHSTPKQLMKGIWI